MLDKIAKILSNYKNYADARITKGTVSSLVSEDRKIKGLDAGISGIGVRVLSKASFGYAWSTRIEDFSELLKKAERLALLNKGDISFASSKPIKKSCGKHYPQLPTEEKLALIKEAEKSAFSSQAKNATLSISDTILEEAFLSSEGSFINQKFSYLYFSALSIAKSGNISQRGIDRAASRKGYGKLDLCKVACNARESAERLLGADSSPKGRFLLVMDPEMTGVFSHEAVGHASEGDSIIERESVLRGKLGKRIANENVTILDDPTFDDFGQYYFDSEG
ncbi:TldD/PmbA family protein, partial [Candidatus Micrarchaeota archaeon]|nr:TldD/PmbA family protein [Candidatus Micrarchaeota archaeon]